MADDWKGEHLISAKGANRRKEATRMANILYHSQRRIKGAPNPAAKAHAQFVLAAVIDNRKTVK